MPVATDSLIARLQADCAAAEAAEAAERSVRASVDAQIKAVETARAFAWRRLNALADMARAAADEPDQEASIERQLIALFREIGWIETSLAELGEGAQPLLAGARAPWDGVGFFVGLGHGGGPMADGEARTKLKEVEAAVMADPLLLNRGRFFDKHGGHLKIEEVA